MYKLPVKNWITVGIQRELTPSLYSDFCRCQLMAFTSAFFTSLVIHQIWKQTFQESPENFWPPIARKLRKSPEESCSCNSYGPLCKFWRAQLGSAAASMYLLATKYQILLGILHISYHLCLTTAYLNIYYYAYF